MQILYLSSRDKKNGTKKGKLKNVIYFPKQNIFFFLGIVSNAKILKKDRGT